MSRTSEHEPGSARNFAVLVARDALVDAEVVRFRGEDGEGENALVTLGRADAAAVGQQLLVSVPDTSRQQSFSCSSKYLNQYHRHFKLSIFH